MPWYHYFCPSSKRKPQLSQSEQPPAEQLESEKIPQGMFINESNEIVMPTEYWKITKTRYEQQHWDKAFAQVQSINARYLDIDHPASVNLILQINHLYCSNLYSLYISNNNIISLEELIFLQAPLLNDLDIRQNYVTSIRSLRKCSFTLDHLFLDYNPLIDFQGLAHIKFNKTIKRNFVSNYSNFRYAFRPGQMFIYNLSQFVRAEPKYIFLSLYIQNALHICCPINTIQRQNLKTLGN